MAHGPVRASGRPDRLRALARDGLLVLTSGGVDPGEVTAALAATTAAPTRVAALADLDPDGELREALGATAGEAWLIRPDCHIAAVVAGAAAAAVAARRLLALPEVPGSDIQSR